MKKNEPCPACGRYANRGVSVDAVIVNKNNQILLIKRKAEPFKEYWGLPGGFVEWNESAPDAVRREIKEETSLKVKSIELVGVYSDPKRHPKQVINIAYAIKAEGKPKAADDALECKFFSIDSLPGKLAFDHRKIINDYLSQCNVTPGRWRPLDT